MIRRKRASTVRKTRTRWNLSRQATATPVIGAEESTGSIRKETSLKHGLRALSDYVIVEEEPIEATHDTASGLTKDVVEAIKGGKLVVPDVAQYALDKFPFRGKVLSVGPKVQTVKEGDRVMFARYGGQRWMENDVQYLTIRACDIHAIIT